MKRIFLNRVIHLILICCFFFSANLSSAQSRDSLKNQSYDQLIKKSRSQRTIGLVLMGVGFTATTIGVAAAYAQSWDSLFGAFDPDYEEPDNTADVVAYTGIAFLVAGIPLLIAAGKNKQRANEIKISFKLNNAPVMQNQLFSRTHSPSLKLVIPLR